MQLNKLNSCIFLRRVYIQILNTLPCGVSASGYYLHVLFSPAKLRRVFK